MDEIYSSDSSESSIVIPSSSIIPESSPTNDPAFESYKGQQFVIVDHTVNIRNGSEISKIWRHGFERRRIDDGTFDRYWRCGHCQHKKILKCAERGNGKTSYPIRHLRNRHFIDLNADDQALPIQQTSFFGAVAGVVTAAVVKTASTLISTMNIDRFRYLLIRWIVMMNISFTCIEHPTWRELMIHCHQGLAPYLISTTPQFRIRLPNAEINLSPRGQRGRGQGVGSPRLSNLEHCIFFSLQSKC